MRNTDRRRQDFGRQAAGGARRRGAPPADEPEGDGKPRRGVVTSVYAEKGYGFLQEAVGEPDEGTQRFFHTTACEIDIRNLRPGDDVTFVPTKGSKGPRAIEIRKG